MRIWSAVLAQRNERPGSALELPETGADAPNVTPIEVVQQRLANAAMDDPGFEAQLSELWRALSLYLEARDGGVGETDLPAPELSAPRALRPTHVGHTVHQLTSYRCSPKPDHHGNVPWFDAHPAHVTVREDDIMPLVNQFFE